MLFYTTPWPPFLRGNMRSVTFLKEGAVNPHRERRKLALAEMYVQGVSTRKVAAITEQMCGFQVSSSQVSKATAELDEQFLATR
jgi:transposase-like protein